MFRLRSATLRSNMHPWSPAVHWGLAVPRSHSGTGALPFHPYLGLWAPGVSFPRTREISAPLGQGLYIARRVSPPDSCPVLWFHTIKSISSATWRNFLSVAWWQPGFQKTSPGVHELLDQATSITPPKCYFHNNSKMLISFFVVILSRVYGGIF